MPRMTADQASQLDHTPTRDHAAAIDSVLSGHYDEDMKPLDAKSEPEETTLDDIEEEVGRQDRSSRKRRKDEEQDRSEPEGFEDEDVEDDDGAEGQPDEEPEANAEDDDDTADATDQESDEEPIQSLADVAEAMEQPLEDVLANLTHTITVDGEEQTVNLREMSLGYMREADYRRKTEEVSQNRKSLEEERAKWTEQTQDSLAVQQQLMQSVQQAYIGGIDRAKLEELRQKDPAKYILAREEIQGKLGSLQKAAQQAAERLEATRKEQQERDQEALREYVDQERQKLEDAAGELTDDRRMALRQFLTEERGFAPEEVGTILDHRLVMLAVDLQEARARLSELEGGDPEKKRAQKKPGRRLRRKRSPSAPSGGRGQAKRRREAGEAKARAKTSGSVRDAAAAIDKLV